MPCVLRLQIPALARLTFLWTLESADIHEMNKIHKNQSKNLIKYTRPRLANPKIFGLNPSNP